MTSVQSGGVDDAVAALLRKVSREIILPHYQKLSADQIEDKAANDKVTVADKLAEQMLCEGLEAIMPGLPIVGEEAAHADPAVLDRLRGSCWIVDPIDGTNNYAAGKPPFGVLLAIADGGVAHSGWIYDCLSDRLCVAKHGKGALVNGERVTAQATNEHPPVAAISTVFLDEKRRQSVLGHIAPHYRLVDTPRCAAEQYPRLALGENDVSMFERTLAWDHAAGALWLNEAGGMVARPDGSPYRVDEIGQIGLIGAASPRLWDELAGRMEISP